MRNCGIAEFFPRELFCIVHYPVLTRRPHVNRFDLEKRTKVFALRVIEFVATLPRTRAGEVIEYQLVKAGTSVGSNYREANRAETRNDFIHKIGIVEKESSESVYWLELCEDAGFGLPENRNWLLQEARELLAIFAATSRTSKRKRAVQSTQRKILSRA
jgi:four helix bundle protein